LTVKDLSNISLKTKPKTPKPQNPKTPQSGI
jgi:hypothetical protein